MNRKNPYYVEEETEEGKVLHFTPEGIAYLMMNISCSIMEKSACYFKKALILFFLSILINILGLVSLILLK